MKKEIRYFVLILFSFLIVISFQLVSAAGKFASGDVVETTIDMKVRPQAGFGTNLNDYFVALAGSKGKVLEGPSSGEGYTWYKINFTNGIGWAVEDYLVKAGTTSNFDRITVLSPIAGQVSGNVIIDANFTPYTSCFGNCQFGFFSAILKNADASTPYMNRLVGQSFSTRLQIPNSQFSFDTNDFANGEYILELIAYNPQGGVISNIKKIPLTINNPPIEISFKYPAPNSVITTSTPFLMDVEITKNGQPYRPTLVGYDIKLANESDEEYLTLGATYPAVNGGDSRGYFGCHLVPVQLHQGKYIIRAMLSQGQSATLPITINLASCPYNDTVDITSPTLTVISPRSGDDSFAESINIKVNVHYPGDSFGLNPGPTQFSACFYNSAGVYTGVYAGGPCTQFWVGITGVDTGGYIMINPDAFGNVDYNWKPSEGVQQPKYAGAGLQNAQTVYPKPPYLISIGASDEKGRGVWEYIYMSSTQTTPPNPETPTNPPPATPLPTATLTATPSTINLGSSSQLQWISNGDCTPSNNWVLKVDRVGDDFQNGIAYSGGETTVSPLETTTYSISCKNSAGQSAGASVTVNVENPNEPPTPLCELTSASWSKNAVGEGETIALNVFGENCDGKTVAFKIWEKDAVGDSDPVRYNPSNALFIRGTASTTALVEWQSDGLFGLAGNPEYYFTASVIGTNEKIDSGLLSVTETPSYVCGDGTCNGIETINTCSVDCSTPEERRTTSIPPRQTQLCGNSAINTGEECDGGTGCSSLCQCSSGYQPTVPTSASCQMIPTVPTISFSASPTSIMVGQGSILRWNSPNADSCVQSGGWSSGGINIWTSASQFVTPRETTTYILTCTNSQGSSSQSVTISVSTSDTETETSPQNPETPTTNPDNPATELSGPLAIGSWIQLAGNTHVRENPDTLSVVLTTQLPGTRGKISEGPVSADGNAWWRVDYETGKDGWSIDIFMTKIAKPGLI